MVLCNGDKSYPVNGLSGRDYYILTAALESA